MAHLAHYKEAHPLPFVITHWVNLICMFCLIVSGFFIHFPYLAGVMGIMRGLHIVAALVILINLVVRIVLGFVIKSAQVGGTRVKGDMDNRNFFPSKLNRHQFIPWIRYYLFLRKDHPIGTKFGSPQKLVYFLVPFVLICSAITGFCLWEPTSEMGFFVFVTGLVGGIMNVRIIHYFLMWLFIIFIILHVYLATIEGKAPVRLMFLYKESPGLVTDPETGRVIGVDNMGMPAEHTHPSAASTAEPSHAYAEVPDDIE